MVSCSAIQNAQAFQPFLQHYKVLGRGIYNIFNQQTYQCLDVICGFLSSLKKTIVGVQI